MIKMSSLTSNGAGKYPEDLTLSKIGRQTIKLPKHPWPSSPDCCWLGPPQKNLIFNFCMMINFFPFPLLLQTAFQSLYIAAVFPLMHRTVSQLTSKAGKLAFGLITLLRIFMLGLTTKMLALMIVTIRVSSVLASAKTPQIFRQVRNCKFATKTLFHTYLQINDKNVTFRGKEIVLCLKFPKGNSPILDIGIYPSPRPIRKTRCAAS